MLSNSKNMDLEIVLLSEDVKRLRNEPDNPEMEKGFV